MTCGLINHAHVYAFAGVGLHGIFLSQEKSFNFRLSDKALENRSFLPLLRAAFIGVFVKQTPRPPSSPRGEWLSAEDLGETSRVSWHKVHEIRDGQGAFLGVGTAP